MRRAVSCSSVGLVTPTVLDRSMTGICSVVPPGQVLMLWDSSLLVGGVGMRMGLDLALRLGSPPSLSRFVLPVMVLRRSGGGGRGLGFPPSLVGLVLPVILTGFVLPVILRQGCSREAKEC